MYTTNINTKGVRTHIVIYPVSPLTFHTSGLKGNFNYENVIVINYKVHQIFHQF